LATRLTFILFQVRPCACCRFLQYQDPITLCYLSPAAAVVNRHANSVSPHCRVFRQRAAACIVVLQPNNRNAPGSKCALFLVATSRISVWLQMLSDAWLSTQSADIAPSPLPLAPSSQSLPPPSTSPIMSAPAPLESTAELLSGNSPFSSPHSSSPFPSPPPPLNSESPAPLPLLDEECHLPSSQPASFSILREPLTPEEILDTCRRVVGAMKSQRISFQQLFVLADLSQEVRRANYYHLSQERRCVETPL
jgi:hypothetical protein